MGDNDIIREHLIKVDRDAFNNNEFEVAFRFRNIHSENLLKNAAHFCHKKYKPTPSCMKNYLLDRFPIIRLMRNYDFRANILSDTVAGLTIGLIHIPQGLAYAKMADLPAYTGLYVSLFSVFMYLILGTSHHLSMGTFAIISLMAKSCFIKFEGKYYGPYANGTNINSTFLDPDPDKAKIMISTALTFLTGMFHLIFSIFRFGFVTKYISKVIVQGFTCGAAYHIIASQISPLIGLPMPTVTIPFKLIGTLIEIYNGIYRIIIEINETSAIPTRIWGTLIVAAVSIFIIAIIREEINVRHKDTLPMPVPIDIIVIFLGTLFSFIFNFEQNYGIKTIGKIESKLKVPEFPPKLIFLFSEIFTDAIGIAIVSFAINISMAKLFAKKI